MSAGPPDDEAHLEYLDPLDELISLTNASTGEVEVLRRAELVEKTYFTSYETWQTAENILEGVGACFDQQDALARMAKEQREEDEKKSLIRMGVATVVGGVAIAYISAKSGQSAQASQAAFRAARDARNETRELGERIVKLEGLVRAADGRVAQGFTGLYTAGTTRPATRH